MSFTKSLIIWEKEGYTSEKEYGPLEKKLRDFASDVSGAVDDVKNKVTSYLEESGLVSNSPEETLKKTYRVLGLNCVITEAHSISNEVTSYPISNGFIISDHVIKRNPIFRLQGWVTNVDMPASVISVSTVGKVAGSMVSRSMGPVIGSLLGSAASIVDSLAMSGNPVKEAYQDLRDLVQSGTVCHISTLVNTYENCVCRSVEIQQNGITATVLPVTLTFEQLQIIDPTTGDVMTTSSVDKGVKKALEAQTDNYLESAVDMVVKSGVNIFSTITGFDTSTAEGI